MKGLKLFLICTIAFSTVAPTFAKDKDERTFWQKHRGKIVKGVAIAAAIGAVIGLTYHGNKTMGAVDRAQKDKIFSLDKRYRSNAIEIVGLLGTLGPDRTLDFLRWAVETDIPFTDEKVVPLDDVAFIVVTHIDKALAYYFYPDSLEDRSKFRGELAAIVPKRILSLVEQAMIASVQEVVAKGKKAISHIVLGVSEKFGLGK